MVTTDAVREALTHVMDPELDRNIVELGMVHDIAIENGTVSFTLALTTLACPLRGQIQEDARARLLMLEDVQEVNITLREMTAEEKEAVFGQRQEGEGSAAAFNRIKHVVAVLSGKGGVGKSTVSTLLAVALQRKGYSVGLLDADITGPSIPKMLLKEAKTPMGSPIGIMPVTSDSGIKIMSINLLLADPNQAVIWRGPLISGAIRQFYGDVLWGELDYLIVDLPPGTSDASLTVLQSIPLNGIVMVTTPQSLAGMVVRKASSMATQLEIPILGVIENMSYVRCPDCGREIELFGPGHGGEVAAGMGAPFLGRLPIVPELTTLADNGRIEEYPAEEFAEVAGRLLAVMPHTAPSTPRMQ
ncbi:MAG TPA: Mrp/NBP35 family ATP-binding protein [Chloroflexi bacterium]|jgi:Mrp family chromosome partitioning ATPase|nr:Mrp/NBP35 family ATP-binding protein [Chloroflexota bacterium]